MDERTTMWEIINTVLAYCNDEAELDTNYTEDLMKDLRGILLATCELCLIPLKGRKRKLDDLNVCEFCYNNAKEVGL